MKKNKCLAMMMALLTVVLVSCKENIDKTARYVFMDETIASYLQKHAQYSEYYRLLGQVKVSDLSETRIRQLLSARGHYTVFAPTNDAIYAYLDTLCRKGVIMAPSWDGFTDSLRLDSIRKVIVKNSIIDSGDDGQIFEIADLPTSKNAEILVPNMWNRKISVEYGSTPDSILVNGCPIDEKNRDIPAINGVIHAVSAVVLSNTNTLGDFIQRVTDEKIEGYYVSSMLAKAVGLMDTLRAFEDEAYRTAYITGKVTDKRGTAPRHRYYGFTFFAETDECWSRTIGKPALDIKVEDVVAYLTDQGVYPQAVHDHQYTHTDNLLNMFVTYHLLPERHAADRLVIHRNELGYDPAQRNLACALTEYYTTMGVPRLMKFYESAESGGVYINRFPELDNRRRGNYHELSCDPDKQGVKVGNSENQQQGNLSNAMIYPLDELLVLDEHTRNLMGKERIRFDVATMFQEMATNDIRLGYIIANYLPNDKEYKYLERAWMNEECNLSYNMGSSFNTRGYCTYMGDELSSGGKTDITIQMPPVPRSGVYEIRYGISAADSNRGMFQFFWGEDKDNLVPQGIPLDLRVGGLYFRSGNEVRPSGMGWEPDGEDEERNAEVDRKLRNNGFMKGARIFSPDNTTTGRDLESQTRRIIVRQFMEADKVYYLRFKSCLDFTERYIVFDYLEYCAKDVYDNPEKPEDVW